MRFWSEIYRLQNPAKSSGWVTVAHISRARGKRGEVSAIPLSSHPERYASLKNVVLFWPGVEQGEPQEIESAWQHGDRWILKFRGVNRIEEAERLAGADVCVPFEERASVPEGEYYHSDLVGCEVIDRRTGESLGCVRDVLEFGGPGLLEVGENGLLIPFARAICVSIDVDARRILVDLPEGLRA